MREAARDLRAEVRKLRERLILACAALYKRARTCC
jgi:hypothetical protein